MDVYPFAGQLSTEWPAIEGSGSGHPIGALAAESILLGRRSIGRWFLGGSLRAFTGSVNSSVGIDFAPTVSDRGSSREVSMKRQVAVAAAAAVASMAWVSRAEAQGREYVVRESWPNRSMLTTGMFAFGVPYVASVVVASTSDRPSDKHLYVPVVGPWFDLANRGDCGNFGQPACDNETAYKVLLVADGIFQGIGALDIAGAFLFPETRIVRTSDDGPRFRVAPSRVGPSGYGVAALGTF
jgi:hypothetical protein